MSYTAWSVVFGEQPTAAKWNQLGANDAGFKDGTNIDNLAILTRHLNASAVTAAKLDFSTQKTINTTTWTGLSYGSGWADYDAATFTQGGYYKDITGIVYLRGVVKRVSGTGTIIATLPAGFRPLRTVGGGAYGDSGQANVQVASNGQVTLVSGSTGGFIYLDRFFFFAEQ